MHHDVVILGGGPAGSATAIRLAGLGFDVALVEQASFPRAHVGICIADHTLALVDYLGLGHQFLAARFWRRQVTAVRWDSPDLHLVEQGGYHVDRAVLDRLLIEHARQAGVRIYQPARAEALRLKGEDGWQCMLVLAGRSAPLSCSFLVDAAGRRSAVAGARIKDGPSLLALHAEWQLDRPAPLDGLIEAGASAWAWYAQTDRDRAMVSLFVDPREARSGGRAQLRTTYARLLEQFAVLQDVLRGGDHGAIRGCDATSAHAVDSAGARLIRVGDAAMSVDPLSSQGVHLALQSGIQAAIIVNTILGKPANAELARRFYRERISERVARFTSRMQNEYARGAAVGTGSFWRQRAGNVASPAIDAPALRHDAIPGNAACALVIARDAVIAQGPVIAGDFVEERAMLSHAMIERPVAFVGGVDVAALLARLPERFGCQDLRHLWRDQLDGEASGQIANWLWQRGVIVEAA